ncbi:MAG: hypothetical protein WCJ18_06025 [Planctomycetota bacterium]
MSERPKPTRRSLLSDEELPMRATALGYVLLTEDADFPEITAQRPEVKSARKPNQHRISLE